MTEKKKINELVYESGMTFEKAESYFFQLDKTGPRYQFVFERNSDSVSAAFFCGNYKIKQVLDGKIIENSNARKNLTEKLFTTIK